MPVSPCAGGYFLTSSHPVVLAPPENYPAYLGLGFEPATILLLLSPKRCLFLTNCPIAGLKLPSCLLIPFRRFMKNNGTVIKVEEGSVEAVNRLVISQAREAVFSHERLGEVEHAFNQTAR